MGWRSPCGRRRSDRHGRTSDERRIDGIAHGRTHDRPRVASSASDCRQGCVRGVYRNGLPSSPIPVAPGRALRLDLSRMGWCRMGGGTGRLRLPSTRSPVRPRLSAITTRSVRVHFGEHFGDTAPAGAVSAAATGEPSARSTSCREEGSNSHGLAARGFKDDAEAGDQDRL